MLWCWVLQFRNLHVAKGDYLDFQELPGQLQRHTLRYGDGSLPYPGLLAQLIDPGCVVLLCTAYLQVTPALRGVSLRRPDRTSDSSKVAVGAQPMRFHHALTRTYKLNYQAVSSGSHSLCFHLQGKQSLWPLPGQDEVV